MPVLRSRHIPSPTSPLPPPKTIESSVPNLLQPPTPAKTTQPLSPPTALPRRRPSPAISFPRRSSRLSTSPLEVKVEVSPSRKRRRNPRKDAAAFGADVKVEDGTLNADSVEVRVSDSGVPAAKRVSVGGEGDCRRVRKLRSSERHSREDKGKGKGKGKMSADDEVAGLDNEFEEGEFDSNRSRRKFSRLEKGKAVVIDDHNDDDDDGLDLRVGWGSTNAVLSLNGGEDPEVDAENGTRYLEVMEFPNNVGEQVPNGGLVAVGEGIQRIDGGRGEEFSLNENRLSRRMDQFKDIARRNASRFAHFVAPDTDTDDELREDSEERGRDWASVEVEGEVPQAQQFEHVEDWPGPISTALKIIRDREMKLGAQGKNLSSGKGGMPLVSWTPRKEAGEQLKRVAPSLRSMCLKVLVENVDLIGSLNYVPDTLRHTLCHLLCYSRKMNAHFFSLLLEGSPSEVRVADCSWLQEEQFEKSFQASDTSNLTVLQLDLCGHCISDSSLIKALQHKGLPALITISLNGACRISDAGLKALVSAAPSLRSMNLSQCTLLTDAGIESIADTLGSILHELYLDDCDTLDAMRILPSLQRLECLEVLSLMGICSVSDKFINKLITSNGPKMKELLLSNCRNLTDSSLKVIAETCSELVVLDISYLRKLTDIGMAYLSNGCPKLQNLKLCRNTFSDDAVAAFLEISGETLKELSLNNITKVGQNTTLSLAKQCKNLERLDLSWCRSLTDDALGLIADSCSSLRLLKVFGLTQITKRFIDGHSNPQLQIIGMPLTPILDYIKRPDFQHGPLHYSAASSR